MPPVLSPQDALNNLAQIAEAAALNGPDRRTIDTSLKVLQAVISPRNAKDPNPKEEGPTEPQPGDVVNASAKTAERADVDTPSAKG